MQFVPLQDAAARATAVVDPRDEVRPARGHALFLDLVERAFLTALYGWLSWRIVASCVASDAYANLILLPSEGLVVLFALIRRRTDNISRQPVEWLLAVAATCAPLLVDPVQGVPLIPPAAGVSLFLFGLATQTYAKLVLGRSFGMAPAHRGLRLSGPYRVVRHPMYAGYLLTHLGFLGLNPSWENLALYVLCYSAQLPRLLAEERLLSRDPAYRRYARVVRHRLIPGIF